ncbi:MAG: DUF6067 family protein [Candidatus Manganitrophus sp. SB1]|nr:DUF6067 family protein [Candidatus Manganitrophus morganii]
MRERKSVFATTALAALTLFVLLWSAGAADAMTVWTEHATVKIRRTTSPKTNQTAAVLKAARNEFEAFQLVVTANSGALSGVDVNVSDLRDAHGNTIPADQIMIYNQAYINVATVSTIQGGTGEWPDALIPKKDAYFGEVRNAFPFSVASGRSQPVWIEVYVPSTATAGVYSGSATVTASGRSPVIVPIQLTVWNFTLPSTSTLKSAHSIDYHLVPVGHGLGSYTSPPSSSHLRLVKLYAKANLLHRLTTNYLPAPQAMGGLSNSQIDWGPFDTTFGPLFDGTETLPGGKLPGAKMTSYSMSFSGQDTNTTFLRGIATHAKAKGWFDRLFQYTLDEPSTSAHWQTIRTRANALHQADPELMAGVTTSIQNATSNNVAGLIDLFIPTIRFMDNKPYGREPGGEVPGGAGTIGNQRSKYPQETWWYQACGSHGCGMVGGGVFDSEGYHLDWPSYMIDLPALFSRIMEWMSFKYNLQGELYYDMVYAFGQRDPWVGQYDFGGNGDGTLYYPGRPNKIGGTSHIPIESIRLKLLREGMEDYEYMHLLKTLGEEAYADEQVAQVVTNVYTWSKNPLLLYDAREKMGTRISVLQGGANPAPTPEPPPPADPGSDPDPDAGAGAGSGTDPDPDSESDPPISKDPDPISKDPGPITPSTGESGSSSGVQFGGCSLLRTTGEASRPMEAVAYLLLFFSPFCGVVWRKIRVLARLR